MQNKKTIILSGKKQSGKSSAAKFIFKTFVNKKLGTDRFDTKNNGDLVDKFNNDEIIPIDIPVHEQSQRLYDAYGIKIYSFADPLKEYVSNLFGINIELMYGSDGDKNQKVPHVLWDNMPPHIRVKYSKPKRGSGDYVPAFGPMSIREILQVFGSDICREIDPNCWARATYKKIEQEEYMVAIITDARFPNEITMGTEKGAQAIRFRRMPFAKQDQHFSETALDDFPDGEYSFIVDNIDINISTKNNQLVEIMKQLQL